MTIWESMGFKDNPYDARYLQPTEEDFRLFVGRKDEARQFRTTTSSRRGMTVIVEGDVGVGKTSFVNAQQYTSLQQLDSLSPHLLPSLQPIQLNERLSPAEIILSVLSTGIFSLGRIHGSDVLDKNRTVKKIHSLVNQVVHSAANLSGGVSVIGSGATFGKSRTISPVQPLAVVPQTLIYRKTKSSVSEANTLQEWVSCVREDFGYDGVFVPINNIDTLDESFVLGFLNQIRDLLLTQAHFWCVLIGAKGLFSSMETELARVSEIITGKPISLNSLSFEEVMEAIERRISMFKISQDIIAPLSEEVIRVLYDISNGEIRFLFKRATDLILDFKMRYPSETKIDTAEAIQILRDLAAERIERLYLTKTEKKLLKQMAAMGSFRPRDYGVFGMKSAQAMNRYLRKFEDLQLLSKTREGKASIYKTCGDVNLIYRESKRL